ncbi:hypothetical protein KAI32_01625 [Candidatus Pacearchaeota archaeon]|nr:hypothetical protein [Candidatus Pacearchaeota archaeon]
MRKLTLIFVISILFFCTFCLAINNSITGDVIATGEAIDSTTAISLSILGPPALKILSPKNEIYLTTNISLDYITNGDEVWYNIDDDTNITISAPMNLSVDNGIHTLNLYANNSYGTSLKSKVFTVNTSKLNIYYDKYKGSNKGSSTDFNLSTYEELQTLDDIVLEHSDYGKIVFNETINVTDDRDTIDNLIDLDANTNISSNYIYINSIELPNLNIPATISFYNLTFSDPRILIGGEVCSSVICEIVNYSEGVLTFNIQQFSGAYSVEETPEDVTPPVVTPSRGGGSSLRIVEEVFFVDNYIIGVKFKQGEGVTEKIIITNKENRKLNVEIRVDKWADLVKVSEPSFSLDPLESKTIYIDFIACEDQIPDIYLGKIIVESENFEKEILFSIVVESKVELFDVRVKVPEKYVETFAGEEFISEIELFNLGETGRVDVKIEYFIKDSEGNVILFEEEVKAVETSLNFLKTFHIPSDILPGKYLIYVKVSYSDQVAGASAWFNINESRGKNLLFQIILVTLTIIFIIIFITLKKMKNSNRINKRIHYLQSLLLRKGYGKRI